MPQIVNNKSNLIKIQSNPGKKSSVRVTQQVINIAGGSPRYQEDGKGKKRFDLKQQELSNLNRLPGTVHYKAPAINSNGLLMTGLDVTVANPYNNEDWYRDGWERLLKDKKKIRLQELLEYKHNKPKGYYTNRVNSIRSSFDMDDSVPHYQRSEQRIDLRDGTTYLDLNNPLHEVWYYMLRAHNEVSNSFAELGFNNDATHYIVDENEKIVMESKSLRRKNKFGRRLEEVFEMPDGTIQEFCKTLQIKATSLTKEEAYKEIANYVERSDDYYSEFMTMYDLWVNPSTKETFLGYAELYDLMSVPGLVSQRQNKVFWMQPANDGGKRENWEWKSRADFVNNFLNDLKYQEEVDIIRALYRAKTR